VGIVQVGRVLKRKQKGKAIFAFLRKRKGKLE